MLKEIIKEKMPEKKMAYARDEKSGRVKATAPNGQTYELEIEDKPNEVPEDGFTSEKGRDDFREEVANIVKDVLKSLGLIDAELMDIDEDEVMDDTLESALKRMNAHRED